MTKQGYVIVGDVHGHYDELQRLLARCPPDYIPVSVGDMVDRGPDSDKCIEFFRTKGLAVKGNHEDMMIDYWVTGAAKYGYGMWSMNGGFATQRSYEGKQELRDEHVKWAASLPTKLSLDDDQLWVTHSGHADDTWTRDHVGYTPGTLKVYGHMGFPGPHVQLKTGGLGQDIIYAVGIDTWPIRCLTALVYPDLYFVSEFYGRRHETPMSVLQAERDKKLRDMGMLNEPNFETGKPTLKAITDEEMKDALELLKHRV